MKKKLIGFLCIFVILNASMVLSYGASNTEDAIKDGSVSKTTPIKFTLEVSEEVATFLAYNNIYQGSYKSELSPTQKDYYELLEKKYLNESGMPNGSSDALIFEPLTEIAITVNTDGAETTLTEESNKLMAVVCSDISYAYFAFIYDHPQVFWTGNMSYKASFEADPITKKGRVAAFIITPLLSYDGATSQISNFVSGVNTAVAAIENERTDATAYATVKAIHDYLCEKLTYNKAAVKAPDSHKYAHSAGPVFTTASPSVVCEGYGKAFKILCDAFDIPCAMVIGTGKQEPHMWNYVQISGSWYAVDVTWDDQSSITYTYFLVGQEGMRNHMPNLAGFSPDGNVSFAYPDLSSTAYQKADSNLACNHSWDAGVVTRAATCKMAGVKTYTCKYDTNHTYTESIPKLKTHAYGSDYICDVCNYVNKSLKPTTPTKPAVTAPAAVKSLKAVLYGYDDVKVTWKKSSDATSYKIYYKKGSGKYSTAKTTKSLSYKFKNLSDGVKYTFKVVPYNGSKAGKAKTYSVYTLKKVTGVKVIKSGTKVKVSWKNISGETGYQISKMTTKKGTQKKPVTVKSTTGKYKKLSAAKGKTYYYKVRAYKVVDGKKIYGPWSNAKKYKK